MASHATPVIPAQKVLTERDTRVILADLITVVIREEHVGREATLRRVGVCSEA